LKGRRELLSRTVCKEISGRFTTPHTHIEIARIDPIPNCNGVMVFILNV
jgi:hypothetical protein